jgi:hypothetical protein
MREHLFDHIDIPAAAIHIPNGTLACGYGAGNREYRQAMRGHDRRACGSGRRSRHRRLLRPASKAPLARHVAKKRGPSSWRGWGRSFPFGVRDAAATSGWLPSSRSRGRSGRSLRTRGNRSSRHPSHQLGARPPNGPSLSRPMTTATSIKRRPTSCQRPTLTASESCRTRGINEAARRPASERLRTDASKTPLQGGRQAFRLTLLRAHKRGNTGNTRFTSRSSARRPLRMCHQPGSPFAGSRSISSLRKCVAQLMQGS